LEHLKLILHSKLTDWNLNKNLRKNKIFKKIKYNVIKTHILQLPKNKIKKIKFLEHISAAGSQSNPPPQLCIYFLWRLYILGLHPGIFFIFEKHLQRERVHLFIHISLSPALCGQCLVRSSGLNPMWS